MGRDRDYGYLGFSHWAEDDKTMINNFDNITGYWPTKTDDLEEVVDKFLFDGKPNYLNLKR